MSDYERHEPMTRGEKKESEYDPPATHFPDPLAHLRCASNSFSTIAQYIDDGRYAAAHAMAVNKEREIDRALGILFSAPCPLSPKEDKE